LLRLADDTFHFPVNPAGKNRAGRQIPAGIAVSAVANEEIWRDKNDESNDHGAAEADKNVLRRYRFEKGLLSSFVSLDFVSKSYDARLHVSAPREKPFKLCQGPCFGSLLVGCAVHQGRYFH
jgi:hypothetical protein